MLPEDSILITEGETGTYDVSLKTQPTATVAVDISVPAGEDASVSPTSLTFTTDKWDEAQTVTITTSHDDDGEFDSFEITHDPSGGDYDDVGHASLLVIIGDDDSPNLDISKSTIVVTEDETTDPEFTVQLTTQPTAEVTVMVTSNNTAKATVVQGSSLTFTTEAWDDPQTVKVRPVHDDDAVDVNLQILLKASGGDYEGKSGSVDVTVEDDETAEFVLQPTSLTVGENGTADFTVKLASQPTANVTVTVTSGDTTAATLTQGASLLFTTTDWNSARTVTVSGVDDSDADSETFDISLTAAGGDYEGVTGTVSLTVTDDDTPNLLIDPTTLIVQEDGSNTFTVELTTLPSTDVTVTVTSGDTNIATVSDGILTFTTDTWDDAQTVTVTGVDDDDGSNESVDISLSAAGGDYAGKTGSVSVTVRDDETIDILVAPTTLRVTEGSTNTFTVRLATEPKNDVTITVTSDDTTVADIPQGGSLSFNSDNWQDEQTVTIEGVEDPNPDSETITVLLSASGGDYEGKTASVSVSVKDNDVPDLDTDPPALDVDENSTDTFTVRLTTRPSADVTVTVTSGDTSIATVSDDSLDFTTGTWNSPRTITVRGVNDADAKSESDRNFTLSVRRGLHGHYENCRCERDGR